MIEFKEYVGAQPKQVQELKDLVKQGNKKGDKTIRVANDNATKKKSK